LTWGLGHGIGLAFLLPWAQRLEVRAIVLRAASLIYVIMLSGVAHGVWTK
jgi:hypothetical protein